MLPRVTLYKSELNIFPARSGWVSPCTVNAKVLAIFRWVVKLDMVVLEYPEASLYAIR